MPEIRNKGGHDLGGGGSDTSGGSSGGGGGWVTDGASLANTMASPSPSQVTFDPPALSDSSVTGNMYVVPPDYF